MALTKEVKISKIEVVGDFKIIFVEEITNILEDGVVLSSSNHRYSFAPNQEITINNDDVKKIKDVFWTDELKSAYEAHISNQIH